MLISPGTQNKDYQKSFKHVIQIWKEKISTNKMQDHYSMKRIGLFFSKVIIIINRKLYSAKD